MKRSAALAGICVLAGCASAPRTAPSDATPAHWARGNLVIVGGGPRTGDIMRRFVELAGGAGRARIVVFPMATSYAAEVGPAQVEELHQLGARAWTLDLTRDEAMRDGIARSLDSATGIWFSGGDQTRLMAVLRGTPVAAAIRARYRDGAAVGGTSAGAAVMTTPMITGVERAPGGTRPDTSLSWVTIARDNVETADGLGLLPSAIVDQHFVRRRRHNRLISLVLEHPGHIGVGIDESTALVVDSTGTWSVIGESVVLVVDPRPGAVASARPGAPSARDLRLHILAAGSRFDPRTGRVELGRD